MPTDPRIDAYIAARAAFARPILTHIRARIHAACPDVEEAIKWGMPAFLYRGRPLANMAAFTAHATLGFWHRDVLKTGREGEAMGQYGRIESLADLPSDIVIDRHVHDAMALIASGVRPPRRSTEAKPEAQVPAELAMALAADSVAHATFYDRFSPSHRREYCEWIAEAKRDETRERRVAQTVEWLREGKQRNWKYQNC